MTNRSSSPHLLTRLRPLLRAVLLSLLTIAALSGLVTALVLPAEVDRLCDRQDVVVLQAAVDPRHQQALLFSRSISRFSPAGSTYQMSVQNLGQTRTQTVNQWQPISLIDTPGGVVVGEADGALRRLLLPWTSGRSEIIGRQPEGAPVQLSCSADGSRLLSLSERYLYLWDLHANGLLQRFERGEIGEAVLSADGTRFYHARPGPSVLIERCCLTGEVLRSISIDCEPLELAIGPDGRRLAMLTCDGQLQVLQLDSGKRLWRERLSEPAGLSATIRFCPRGESMVTAHRSAQVSREWTIEVRHVLSGRREAAFTASQRVFGAAITADQVVQSWGADGSFCQWNQSLPRAASGAQQQISLRPEPHPRTAME